MWEHVFGMDFLSAIKKKDPFDGSKQIYYTLIKRPSRNPAPTSALHGWFAPRFRGIPTFYSGQTFGSSVLVNEANYTESSIQPSDF